MNPKRIPSIVLGILQVFIGVGAIGSGVIIVSDPSGATMGVTTDPLQGSPFHNYLIPGLFLLIVNGAGSVAGGVVSLARKPTAGICAMMLGAILMAWIVIQVLIIGLSHWLQPLFFGVGLVELMLGLTVARFLRRGA